MKQYRDAIIAIGEKYGIKVIDLYSIAQISSYNKALYLRDGVHPNQLGTDLARNVLINEMKSINVINTTPNMPN